MDVDVLDVKINPKILGGVHDYITAATYDDMDAAISGFDSISQQISPQLKTFSHYTLKRIDYCINFSLDELAPKCSPERMMSLIKRADIPPHYREWTEYDPVSHRTKSRPSSFYLICKSVKLRTVTLGSGHLLVVDHIHPILLESVKLAVKVLLLGADTGISKSVVLHIASNRPNNV